jgi:hypothetical protein
MLVRAADGLAVLKFTWVSSAMPIPVRRFFGRICFLRTDNNAVGLCEFADQAEVTESSQLSWRALGTRKCGWLQADQSRVIRRNVFTVRELR